MPLESNFNISVPLFLVFGNVCFSKNLKMRIFLIGLLALTYFHAVNSDPYVQKNLILVYDVINPGVNYLQFVKGVGKIYQELIQPGSNEIFNKLLVIFPLQTSVEIHPFSGGYADTIMEEMLKLQSTIEEEKTLANASRVLVGLWQGIYKADPNSLIYVFTNAKPEDKSMISAITSGIESKLIEVGFVIEQNHPERDIPEEYQAISLQSNGLIMNVHTDTRVMNFLPILLTSTKNKVNLLTFHNNSNKVRKHTVKVDKFLDEITIASFTFGGYGFFITHHFCQYNHIAKDCHHSHVETTTPTDDLCPPKPVETTPITYYILCKPKRKRVARTDITDDLCPPKNIETTTTPDHSCHQDSCTNEALITRHLCDIKTRIVSFKNISQEDLYITVDTNSYLFGLRIFGTSKFNFDFGFSIEKINCTKIMQKRPIMYNSNYIYVRPTYEEYGAEFISGKIIATDLSFTKEITLQKISSRDEIYYGTFVPTSQPFYLQVTAVIEDVTIQRMSSIPISPIQKLSPQNTYENNEPIVYKTYTKTNYYGTAERFFSNRDNPVYYDIETGQKIKDTSHN